MQNVHGIFLGNYVQSVTDANVILCQFACQTEHIISFSTPLCLAWTGENEQLINSEMGRFHWAVITEQ